MPAPVKKAGSRGVRAYDAARSSARLFRLPFQRNQPLPTATAANARHYARRWYEQEILPALYVGREDREGVVHHNAARLVI